MSVKLEKKKIGAFFESAFFIMWLQSKPCLDVRNVLGLIFS